jgi:hypothetical protein
MWRTVLSVAALVAAAMALPAFSVAQAPTEDSVVGSGTAVDPGVVFLERFDLNARSGPSGENPTGTASLAPVDFPSLRIAGPVTCLNVTGNRAVIGVDNSLGTPALGDWFFEVTDGAPDSIGVFGPLDSPPSVCPVPGIGAFPVPVVSGDIVVTDARPFPTSKDQCKNGGWRTFPGFRNQGECVAFVERGPKPKP